MTDIKNPSKERYEQAVAMVELMAREYEATAAQPNPSPLAEPPSVARNRAADLRMVLHRAGWVTRTIEAARPTLAEAADHHSIVWRRAYRRGWRCARVTVRPWGEQG